MKNIECIGSGLICDNPKCDWEDKTITFEELGKHLNRKCPKCGENVLTEEDYETVKKLHKSMDFVNSLDKEQLDGFSEIFGGKKIPKGDEKVTLHVKIHKGVQIVNIDDLPF